MIDEINDAAAAKEEEETDNVDVDNDEEEEDEEVSQLCVKGKVGIDALQGVVQVDHGGPRLSFGVSYLKFSQYCPVALRFLPILQLPATPYLTAD